MTRATGPGLLDALSFVVGAADELVLRSVRDTHVAVADRVHRALARSTGGASEIATSAHRGIATAVYAAIGLSVRGAGAGLDAAGRAGLGPRLEAGPSGRAANAVVNGLMGDRLRDERPALAIPMAVRVDHADVPVDAERLAAAFPDATGPVVVLVHGLSEHEGSWGRHRERLGTTYAETLAAEGWTPVHLRLNTGLPVRENGVLLASLLQDLTDAWPVELERLALIGHSMGGLVVRSACSVVTEAPLPWAARVSDVVTLGTPHLGAPLAAGVGRSAAVLARLPETAAFGRILDWRSLGVRDLVDGLDDAVPALPHARYRLVHATLTHSADHPVSRFFGDLLVRVPSASGRGRNVSLFPDAEVLHLPRSGHLELLNHPRVHDALRGWLA
jgi:pimeloyl-ACP methyl ester carboxylesterase